MQKDPAHSGSYGLVYRIEWRGCSVAVKRIPIKESLWRSFVLEAQIIIDLRGHPCALQPLGFFRDNEYVYILTQYIEAKFASDYLDGTQSIKQSKNVLLQYLSFFYYAVCKGYVPMDCQGDNVLIDTSGTVFFVDYGEFYENNNRFSWKSKLSLYWTSLFVYCMEDEMDDKEKQLQTLDEDVKRFCSKKHFSHDIFMQEFRGLFSELDSMNFSVLCAA